MTPSLSELIERLERAEAGSQELDADIWRHFNRADLSTAYVAELSECPHYTTSIDAALSLVPEGVAWVVSKQSSTFAACGPVDGTEWVAWSEGNRATTPALALCVAALKARQFGER